MERYSSRSIDELGRFVLHSELRRKLNLNTGDKVYLTPIDTIMVLTFNETLAKSHHVICEIDDIGMIILPNELKDEMGWKTNDRLSAYHTDNIVILKLEAID